MHIRFNNIEGFIRVYDGTRYLVLFGGEKYYFLYNRIRYLTGVKIGKISNPVVKEIIFYNRIRYLTGVKIGITYVISHNYAKIKVDSFDSLPLEQNVTFHVIYNL